MQNFESSKLATVHQLPCEDQSIDEETLDSPPYVEWFRRDPDSLFKRGIPVPKKRKSENVKFIPVHSSPSKNTLDSNPSLDTPLHAEFLSSLAHPKGFDSRSRNTTEERLEFFGNEEWADVFSPTCVLCKKHLGNLGLAQTYVDYGHWSRITSISKSCRFSISPEITLSALGETGQAELTIPVLKQRSYTDRSPVIPSVLADTLCADLGVIGLFEKLNDTLRTSYNLDTYETSEDPHSRLRCWRESHSIETQSTYIHFLNAAFNETTTSALPTPVYAVFGMTWPLLTSNMNYEGGRRETGGGDKIALLGRLGITVWNFACVEDTERINVWTPINGYEWPMLNLGVQYAWLDVLCLRQAGGLREDLREEEWKVDVPTIGYVYQRSRKVVCYFSGLGRPLNLKPGDFQSNRFWFNRAWMLQEISEHMIVGGETGDGTIQEDIKMRFLGQLASLRRIRAPSTSITVFDFLSQMKNRVSTNPMDRVAGLVYLLRPKYIPIYDAALSQEGAWVALVNAMEYSSRVELLFLYPEPGDGTKYWRPSWE
ncbi:hypothetical protein ARMGADRAFT_1169583 [Armillaria gallica]|uniref:Heterokaryon incompatibility domain-containing protein n=1 Tax=Armillaria gallica TaxID=47427 RepID=A0A2H3D453_ARMGA|nr:hypothetical protein ARMGADRAFT_1169583 [Armillaria gallica]